ncbi:hypothetical protein V8G61_12320 [Gaetbulibacter sp. M240]|uniref:hypothetical protein n=1 Tax=Gaetbulibacter sp. M240 TaxID=3126511 RepID=UPI00374EC03A
MNLDFVNNPYSDIIQLLIYRENLNVLNNGDQFFAEPLVFAYFNNKKNNLFPKAVLKEILQSYFFKKEPLKIKYSFNQNGVAYIPKLGYFKEREITPFEPILMLEDFEVLKEIHPLLKKYFVEFYKGHIVNNSPAFKSVWKEHYDELKEAILTIKIYLPEFYDELKFANKKIYLHDNPKILNFTTIETLGMLYFYVVGKKNLVYFIEELIHQGSHNYLYYIIHNKRDFFKIDVENLVMRDFNNKDWDYRTIYGAFHGLFTVKQRVKCFDKLLSQNVFSGPYKHELLGRLADQFSRFRTGLELLDLNDVFTPKGVQFYEELDSNCYAILEKYKSLKNEFDLSNRDLDFRYKDFCELNPFETFQKKDEFNYYQF